jgi:hypothetical protein
MSSFRISLPDVILQAEQFNHSPGLAEIADQTPRRAWDLSNQSWRGEYLIRLGLIGLRENVYDLHLNGVGQKCLTHTLHGFYRPQRTL